MMGKKILIWEELRGREKWVVKVMRERCFSDFMGIWLGLIEGEKFRCNWELK